MQDHEEFMESTTLLEKSVSAIFRATSEVLQNVFVNFHFTLLGSCGHL